MLAIEGWAAAGPGAVGAPSSCAHANADNPANAAITIQRAQKEFHRTVPGGA
jgi:hypothetical protein